MYFTFTSNPSSLSIITLIPPLHSSPRNPINFPSFAPNHYSYARPQIRRVSLKCSHKPQNPLRPPPVFSIRFPELSTTSTSTLPIEKQQTNPDDHGSNTLQCIAKPIVFTVFWMAIGLFPVFRGVQLPAIAAMAVASEAKKEGTSEAMKGETAKQSNVELDFLDFSRRLMDKFSGLSRSIEEVRLGKGDLDAVNVALREVKSKKKELKEELLSEIDGRLWASMEYALSLEGAVGVLDLRLQYAEVDLRRAKEITIGSERKKARTVKKVKGRIAKLEADRKSCVAQYDRVWEKIDKLETRDVVAVSILRELSFIERESEILVEKFREEMRQQANGSAPKSPLTKLSRSDIQKELQNATRQFREQTILPRVLEAEDIVNPSDQDSIEFAKRIKQALQYSRDLQSNLEANIRKNMEVFGDEKCILENTPVDEVVKGFPEVEMKWMFGHKEVVVPNAAGLHLYHGWKKWREESKAELKRNLLENVDFGKKYVEERQDRILLDRDRVASKTWYNEKRKRWEMDPVAVPFAVSRKLVENARIRHDWDAMYLELKADGKEYFVDMKEFERLFKDFGGLDELYLRMLACGIPTAVQLMPIPFSDLDIRHHLLVTMRFSQQFLNGLWNTDIVESARGAFMDTTVDIIRLIVFSFVQFIPFPVKMQVMMARTKFLGQIEGSEKSSNWLSEAELSSRTRITTEGFLFFAIRSIIYGYVLFHLFRFMKREVPRLLGCGPLRTNPNLRKLQRVKAYFQIKAKLAYRLKRRRSADPVTKAFEQMKRVKNPPIPLKEFASIASIREEINEVVAFLQNPRAFQEMGARAPRGVLIVGEPETGKTSLAMAIAAEAKVPVVQVTAQQLEPGHWVGQGASNVRELFQTARELAPVIIFVEDFERFAGVRGQFIHTKKQDHEGLINQLLVELDGFEKQDGVILLATTGNLHKIDEALQRPGRMDRVFRIQRPTQTERETILRVAAKETMDEELIDFVDWGKVAEKTALLRPIELKRVPLALEGNAFRSKFLDPDELMCYMSWFATFGGIIPDWVRKTKIMKMMSKMLVNHLGLALTKEDLQNVVDLMEPYGVINTGIELHTPPTEWTRETKFPHAVWAAGRGLITFLLPNYDVIENLWLEPLAWEGIGCVKVTNPRSEGSSVHGTVESRSYLEKKLVFLFGSFVASQFLLPFGEENILCHPDLHKAEELATRMVLQYGWGPDDSPTIYHQGNAKNPLSIGDNYEQEIAAKVVKIYDSAYDKARNMLHNNRRTLEMIVEELLEFESLWTKDLERIFAASNGVRGKEPFSLSKGPEEPVFRSIIENGSVSGAGLSSAGN